jgi:hypothetical protein
MHVEFIYTPEDLAAATKAAAALPKSANAKNSLKFGRGVFGWLLFIGLATMLFMVLNAGNQRSKNPSRGGGGGGSPAATPSAPMTGNDVMSNVVLPFVPWLLIFLFIWFFVFRQLRKSGFRAIADDPQFQQVQSLDVDADGVRLATPLAETRWKWANFSGMSETPELLFVHLRERTVLVIPKRAFSTPEQLDEMRSTIRANVSEHTGAFPVLPVASTSRPPENHLGN